MHSDPYPSRLDYCNSVLAGLPAYMFKRLQSVLWGSCLARPSVTWLSKCANPDGRKLALARISTSSHVQVVCPDLQRSAWIGTRLLVQTMCSCSRSPWLYTSQVGFTTSAGQLMVPITNSRTIRRLETKGSHTDCGPVAWNNLRSDDCTP